MQSSLGILRTRGGELKPNQKSIQALFVCNMETLDGHWRAILLGRLPDLIASILRTRDRELGAASQVLFVAVREGWPGRMRRMAGLPAACRIESGPTWMAGQSCTWAAAPSPRGSFIQMSIPIILRNLVFQCQWV